jgi:uncharacterized protein (DUF58 family)
MNKTEANRSINISKNKSEKNKKSDKAKSAKIRYRPLKYRRRFALMPNFYIFCLFWVFSLIFTQALRSPQSSVLFLFVTLIPYINLAYVFAARASLKAGIGNSCSETTKFSPVSFSVTISNESLLPLPFVEADIVVPNETNVRCLERRMYLSLTPNGVYEIKDNVTFAYRGQYDIGVSNMFVYDFFRLFRLKIVEQQYQPIFVLPRRLAFEYISENAASDVNTESVKNIRGIDRAEMSDVRAYRQGDHMKTIHWKLSSKTQEMQVKEYAMNSGKTVYIFCDLAAHYNTELDNLYEDDINEFAVDGVIEIAIAAAMREVKLGNTCKLIWYDSRIPNGTQICYMESPEDLERGFKTFATAELCPVTKVMTKLVALISETQGVTVLFITPLLDSELIDGLAEASALFNNVSSSGAVDLYYFNPEERIIDEKEKIRHKEYADACKLQLISTAVNVSEIKL